MSFFIGFILSVAICLSFIWFAKGTAEISIICASGIFLGILHFSCWEWLIHLYKE
jgi:hypothetical protein